MFLLFLSGCFLNCNEVSLFSKQPCKNLKIIQWSCHYHKRNPFRVIQDPCTSRQAFLLQNNDWLHARYLLIIEHYEIFFVWLFNMHLGWLLYAGCTAFSRPSLPVIFTFASHCDQHGSVLPPGHLLIWVYQRFARDRMLKGDSVIRPCDSARLPFRCDHNIQPSRIGIRLMPPGCCFHVCLRFIDERRGLHPVLSLGTWPYAGDAQPIH